MTTSSRRRNVRRCAGTPILCKLILCQKKNSPGPSLTCGLLFDCHCGAVFVSFHICKRLLDFLITKPCCGEANPVETSQ